MTHLPPPMSPPVNYGRPQTPPTNSWAVVSLVCGIVGCLVLTPFVAVVAGIIGLTRSRRQGGQAMAVIGLVLGTLWIVGGLVVGVGGFYVFKNLSYYTSVYAKPQTISLINRLGSGNVSRDPTVAGLTDADLQAVAAVAGRLGTCRDITIDRSNLVSHNNDMSIEFGGTAVFDKGQAAIDARMRVDRTSGRSQPTMIYERLELK